MNSESEVETQQRLTTRASQLVGAATYQGKRLLLRLQSLLRSEPREMCLITGAPRSGTGAMSHWLRDQPGTLVLSESRRLLAVHRFVQEAERFKRLRPEREMLHELMRQVVYETRYPSRRVWGRVWIEKEPLEPIAFPDKDYRAFIESIRHVWPEGKVLFMIRDPLACIWSMTQRPWGYSVEDAELQRFSLDTHIENWKACASLIAHYGVDENTYVCQFERLVEQPERESNRIATFLGLTSNEPFSPRPTKTVGFSYDEKARILEAVGPQLEALSAAGVIEAELFSAVPSPG